MAKTKGDKKDPNAKFKRKRGGGTEKKQRSNHSLNPGFEIFRMNCNYINGFKRGKSKARATMGRQCAQNRP
jgi:hypothetical protein